LNDTDKGRERIRRVLNASSLSILCRVITVATMFLTTPLILRYLGEELFGVWMTISSLVALLGILDLGVGNSLINVIAKAHGSNDREQTISVVRSASAALIVIAFFYIVISFLFQNSYNWAKIYNLNNLENTTEVARASMILIICLAATLPFTVVQKVQFGFQEAVQANAWTACSNLLVLALILLAIFYQANLSWLVFIVAGTPGIVMMLCWINQFARVRPWLRPRPVKVRLKSATNLMKMSGVWTVFNLVAFLVMGLDNLIISYLFGAKAVGGYAVMAKIHGALLFAQIFTMPLWPAFAEAISSGDFMWARQTFYKTLVACSLIGIFTACIIGFGSFAFVRFWVGPEMIPTISLAVGFAIWAFICNFFAAISALMSNVHMIRTLTILTTAAALSAIVLKFFLAKNVGIEGVVWASSIAYSLVCIPALYIAGKALNKESKNTNEYVNKRINKEEA